MDALNPYVLVILLFLGLVCAIYSKRSIEHELPQKVVSFYTIYQLLITGLCGITVTGDIFNMYVFIEITCLSAYALIASRGKIALKASFTYLVLGSIGACFFLLGIGFLYSVTGSLNIKDLSILLPPFYGNRVVLAAFVFFIVGLSIKMALFPLHTWLPDTHAFAPSEISAMLSGIIIEVSTYAFIRVAFSVFTVGLGQLATAIGRHSFPGSAQFTVATPGGSDKPSPDLLEFLGTTGLPDSGLETEPLEALAHDFSSYVVLVAVNGEVADYVSKVPFHTSARNWSIPAGADRSEQYRALRREITDLVTLLAGESPEQG